MTTTNEMMSGWATMASLPVWISGHGSDTWHVARQIVATGERTGKVYSVGYVAACNGRQLGGAYGYSRAAAPAAGDKVCARCAAMARR